MGADKDIVERLQSAGHFYAPPHDAILYEAAAEIGRLRGEVDSAAAEECQVHREAHMRLDTIVMGAGVFELLHEGGMSDAWENTIAAVTKLATPTPAMPNGVGGLAGVRDTLIVAANNPSSHGREIGLRRIMLEQASRIDATIRAADNRDAAGVERQPDGYMAQWAADQLRSNKYVSCHLYNHQNKVIHGDGKEAVPFYFGLPTPAAVPAGEAVAEVVAVGPHNLSECVAFFVDTLPLGTKLYTTPPAPVQAAPQEGAPRWVDDCQGKASYDGALVSVSVRTWPGNYSAGNRPSGKIDVLRLGKVVQSIEVSADTETQLRAAIESKVSELAANPSACELVVDDAMVERACLYHFPDWDMYGPAGKMVRSADIRRLLTAALQHRGDSRGGEWS